MNSLGEAGERKEDILVVMPSVHVDSHLQDCAAEAVRARYQHSNLNESSLSSSDEDKSDHDTDMSPPEVLLDRQLRHAEEMTHQTIMTGCADMYQSRGLEWEEHEVLKCWVHVSALAKIVHGKKHHLLAKAHVQLGRMYLDNLGLDKQALLHASRGCDMLCGPDGQLAATEGRIKEAWLQLGTGHCVTGRAHIAQGSLILAEKRIQNAEKILRDRQIIQATSTSTTSSSDSKLMSHSREQAQVAMGSSGEPGSLYLLEREITAARARLDLKRGHFKSSSKHFARCIELSRSLWGLQCSLLIPLLRGHATAEANLSRFSAASQSLVDAKAISEHLYGKESVMVAEILQAQGRLASALVRAGDSACGAGDVECFYMKAVSMFAAKLGSSHKKSLSCKMEYCKFLAAQADYQENAIDLLKELIGQQKDGLGEISTEVGYSLKLLSSLFLQKRKLKEATALLEEAKFIFTCSLGAKHKETAGIKNILNSLTLSPEKSQLHQGHWKV